MHILNQEELIGFPKILQTIIFDQINNHCVPKFVFNKIYTTYLESPQVFLV